MSENADVFGCFVKTTADGSLSTEQQSLVFEKGKLFRTYIFGEKGINNQLKKVKNIDCGEDLVLILFQFYVYLMQEIEPIDYRKREKSVGIPIVINDENFFSKSEEERYLFLKDIILDKMNLLAEFVKKKNLDTDVEALRVELLTVLN